VLPSPYLNLKTNENLSTGAAVTNTLSVSLPPLLLRYLSLTQRSGPLIIKGFGFDSRQTILLNIPFGFVQSAVCILGCLFAARFGYKGLIIISLMLPCILGAGLLYGESCLKGDSGSSSSLKADSAVM